MRPTGNCSPALAERLTLFLALVLPVHFDLFGLFFIGRTACAANQNAGVEVASAPQKLRPIRGEFERGGEGRKKRKSEEETCFLNHFPPRISPPTHPPNSLNMAPKVKDASKKPAKKTAGPTRAAPFPAHVPLAHFPTHACKY